MNKKKCLKLIKLFESHRVLWDQPYNNHFYNKEMKNAAWKDISDKMNMPVNELKKKMTNLRGVYRKEKCRIRNTLDTDGEPYKSKWFAYQEMTFLPDIKTYTKNESSSIKPDIDTEVEIESQSEDIESEDNDVGIHESPVNESFAQSTSRIEQEKIDPLNCIPTNICKNQGSKSNHNTSMNSTMIQDTNDVFGKLIAAELRKYDNHTLTYVKKAIMEVIFQADMGNIPPVKIDIKLE